MNQDRFKFRIWVEDIQEMSYSDDWETMHQFFADHYPMRKQDALMQYTGIKDMEGNLVYEGDILEYKQYYANIKWWSSVEEIPLIAERTEQQRQDFSIESNRVRFDDGSFCLGYTPLSKYCRNNVLTEHIETGQTHYGDFETKKWDFKVIGNIYDTRSIG